VRGSATPGRNKTNKGLRQETPGSFSVQTGLCCKDKDMAF